MALDTGAQAREEQQLQTYTEISSTLSRYSASAAASVAPTLADVILKQAQSKQRIEENSTAIGTIWTEAFDIFVTEVIRLINARVDATLKTIREEGNQVLEAIITRSDANGRIEREASSFSPSGNSRMGATSMQSASCEGNEAPRRSSRGPEDLRDHKRRRLTVVSNASRSPTESCQSAQRLDREQQSDIEPDMESLIRQMKLKINSQAQFLRTLTKENNEVRFATLTRTNG